MLLEQAQQQYQHGNNLLAAVGTGNNLQPYWGFPPPPYPTTPHPQAHSLAAGKACDDPVLVTQPATVIRIYKSCNSNLLIKSSYVPSQV